MNEDIRQLIESLRRGEFEDPHPRIELLAAALQEQGAASVEMLLSLLNAPQVLLRVAAVRGCQGQTDASVLGALHALLKDSDLRVREALAGIVSCLPADPQLGMINILARDSESRVRAAALKASANCAELRELQQEALSNDPDYEVRAAAAQALGSTYSQERAVCLLKTLAQEEDDDVQRACAEVLEGWLRAGHQDFPKSVPEPEAMQRVLEALGRRRFPKLLLWIRRHPSAEVNLEALGQLGLDLTAQAEKNAVPRAFEVESVCRQVMDALIGGQARSVVLLGEAGCGKTAVIQELVHQLRDPAQGGWRVVRVTPSDFLTNTKYIGEWESRVKSLVETVRRPRRVIVYIPNLGDLAFTGRHEKSDSNVAAALAPYIEDGSVRILGESSPAEYDRGVGGIPSLQRLFTRIHLPEASIEQTRRILQRIRDRAEGELSDALLDQLLELSVMFLGHTQRPGNAVSLLRTVLERMDANAPSLRLVLDALSESTGIPADLLDDAVSLDLASVSRFFESRVMGQPEAVETVTDLVTMVKAGLTDPRKPFGVLLFVGPTGVGKTELARALAEFIFGDPKRLHRFDMSEFASYDAYERLIGAGFQRGLLTDAVREQPFSVVLLDEIEKAHINVFDLCLQVFDAGRLTDGRGRTVDFRSTILILTSNVGATAPGLSQLGFKPGTNEPSAQPDPERTFRELSQCFRPEFLNRLDRIVNFRPLTLEVAESIARKEVGQVLQRSGIHRRGLQVDIDPAVLALLVKEGYSTHFGARPLKRAVERLVLLPLGRWIASGQGGPETLLRLVPQGEQVAVSVVRRAEPRKTAPVPSSDTPEQIDLLLTSMQDLETQSDNLAARKSQLLAVTQEPGFYQDAARRTETFDEIHKLEEFLTLQRGLRTALEGVHRRFKGGKLTPTDQDALRLRAQELAGELDQLRAVAACKNAQDLGDALLCLTLAHQAGGAQRAIQTLTEMYLNFARRRRMDATVLAERYLEKEDAAYLEVAGLGAFGLLKPEAGLHEFERRFRTRAARSGREAHREDTEIVRVEVIPFPLRLDPVKNLQIKSQPVKPAKSRLLEKADLEVSAFHEPSLRSLRIWTKGPRTEGAGRVNRIVSALVAFGPAIADPAVVRRYSLGNAPGIKDYRSGRTISRVDRVLKGHLELLWES